MEKGDLFKQQLLAFLSKKAGRRVTTLELCQRLEMSYTTLRAKCNGDRDFKVGEIKELVKLYGLSDDEVLGLFFRA